MPARWDASAPGVVVLPSGRLVRGRSLRDPVTAASRPDWGLCLAAQPPEPQPWPVRWVRWPDFWLPTDRADARDALVDAWRRSADERVEVACAGGRGRTGTGLACLAVVDGVPAAEAVAFVRRHFHPAAVETPWQRRYVNRFARSRP